MALSPLTGRTLRCELFNPIAGHPRFPRQKEIFSAHRKIFEERVRKDTPHPDSMFPQRRQRSDPTTMYTWFVFCEGINWKARIFTPRPASAPQTVPRVPKGDCPFPANSVVMGMRGTSLRDVNGTYDLFLPDRMAEGFEVAAAGILRLAPGRFEGQSATARVEKSQPAGGLDLWYRRTNRRGWVYTFGYPEEPEGDPDEQSREWA